MAVRIGARRRNTVLCLTCSGGAGAGGGADAEEETYHSNLVKVEQAAAGRIAATCPHFQVCGGWRLPAHRDFGAGGVEEEIFEGDAFAAGGDSWTGEIAEHTAKPYGYRNGRSGLTGRHCRGRWDIFRRRARTLCLWTSVRCCRGFA